MFILILEEATVFAAFALQMVHTLGHHASTEGKETSIKVYNGPVGSYLLVSER